MCSLDTDSTIYVQARRYESKPRSKIYTTSVEQVCMREL